MKRRPFLLRVWSALGLLLVGGWSGFSLAALHRAGRRREAPLALDDPRLETLEPGAALLIEGWWLRREDEGLLALSRTCTHLGCTLAPAAGGEGLACPCHRSRFDAAGQPLSGPAREPLARRHLRRKDGRWVEGAPAG
ncbi:MAG: ubiquinol-cytochrome c reductase iron-sulfur subunit [Deltaproteobacteria bacterium]|nr:ubiquinol-cytochrome c reductase iron-sulfur subunit [Deltaproteobacteria bacterium]